MNQTEQAGRWIISLLLLCVAGSGMLYYGRSLVKIKGKMDQARLHNVELQRMSFQHQKIQKQLCHMLPAVDLADWEKQLAAKLPANTPITVTTEHATCVVHLQKMAPESLQRLLASAPSFFPGIISAIQLIKRDQFMDARIELFVRQ